MSLEPESLMKLAFKYTFNYKSKHSLNVKFTYKYREFASNFNSALIENNKFLKYSQNTRIFKNL